nr:MAG TPA: hypothetical protein [Caudoviricetes sp.]
MLSGRRVAVHYKTFLPPPIRYYISLNPEPQQYCHVL